MKFKKAQKYINLWKLHFLNFLGLFKNYETKKEKFKRNWKIIFKIKNYLLFKFVKFNKSNWNKEYINFKAIHKNHIHYKMKMNGYPPWNLNITTEDYELYNIELLNITKISLLHSKDQFTNYTINNINEKLNQKTFSKKFIKNYTVSFIRWWEIQINKFQENLNDLEIHLKVKNVGVN